MRNRKKIIVVGLATISASVSFVLGLATVNFDYADALAVKNTSDNYSLTLNSSNKITSSGDKVQKTANRGEVIFTYNNVSSSTTGHTTLNQNGYLVNKDQITSNLTEDKKREFLQFLTENNQKFEEFEKNHPCVKDYLLSQQSINDTEFYCRLEMNQKIENYEKN